MMEFDRSFIVPRKAVERDELRQTGAAVLTVVSSRVKDMLCLLLLCCGLVEEGLWLPGTGEAGES